jgi:hypothetical protein
LSCCTSLFHPMKLLSISTSCGSSVDMWQWLVPLRPRWPCLDIDSITTIVSLPG